MLIGVPKEIKNNEKRVGLVANSVRELISHGHEVLIETGAGAGIGQGDAVYERLGARIASDAAQVFAEADMVVKVKEPQASEYRQMREGQTLFTYLHLAPDPEQTRGLLASGCTAIAYETVTSDTGGLPLLAPMSEVAGRMAVQEAANCLETAVGGCGILLGGVPGVEPAKVVIVGGGVAGSNATAMAFGMGADVVVLDRNIAQLRRLDSRYQGRVKTVYSTAASLDEHVLSADVVIGTVLIPGARAPKLITAQHIKEMQPGSVIVDVSVDQGGCAETTRATTHQDPTYIVNDVVHYCVANMPGGVARTSAFALNNATLPFVLALADKGVRPALEADRHLMAGLNIHKGVVTYQSVAEDLDLPYQPAAEAIAA